MSSQNTYKSTRPINLLVISTLTQSTGVERLTGIRCLIFKHMASPALNIPLNTKMDRQDDECSTCQTTVASCFMNLQQGPSLLVNIHAFQQSWSTSAQCASVGPLSDVEHPVEKILVGLGKLHLHDSTRTGTYHNLLVCVQGLFPCLRPSETPECHHLTVYCYIY